MLNLVARSERERREWVEGVKAVFAMSKGVGGMREEDGGVGGGAEVGKRQPREVDVGRFPEGPALDVSMQLLAHGYLVRFVWEEQMGRCSIGGGR